MKPLRLGGLSLSVACFIGLLKAPETVMADEAAAAPVAVPPLAYGVSDIIQMSQAQVGDPTIVTFIKNSGNSYGLDGAQVIYLHQQGVSTAVITAMLTQPAAGSQPVAAAPENIVVPVAAPVVTVVPEASVPDAVPASTVYVIPDTQTCRYYHSYRPATGYSPIAVYTGSGGYRGGCNHGAWYH